MLKKDQSLAVKLALGIFSGILLLTQIYIYAAEPTNFLVSPTSSSLSPQLTSTVARVANIDPQTVNPAISTLGTQLAQGVATTTGTSAKSNTTATAASNTVTGVVTTPFPTTTTLNSPAVNVVQGTTDDSTPPTISSISDQPDPFSPNGDSVVDTTTVSFTSNEAGTYTVQILNASLMGGQNITGSMIAGVNNAVWDGSGFSESTVPDGTYSYLIEADDASGNRAHGGLPLGTHTITVDTSHPSVSFVINNGDATTVNPSVTFNMTCVDTLSSCASAEVSILDPEKDATPGVDVISGIHVYSDSDPTGELLDATETGSATGVFLIQVDIGLGPGEVGFTDGESMYVDHTYGGTPGTKTGGVRFEDAAGNGSPESSDTIELVASAVPTNLVLDPIRDVTATTGFTLSGTLSNANTGEPITGQLITFTGSGVNPSVPDVITDGVDFIGDVNIVSCPTPAVPGPTDCAPDELNTAGSDGTDNMVLHLGVGGNITFPDNTTGAKLWIQNMGATSFKYVVEEGNGVVQPEAASGGSLAVVPIVQILSGFSTVGGDFVPNGIKKIRITEVGGNELTGSVGIAAIVTINPDGLPAEQHQINFEEFTAGPKTSPFTVNAGHFFAVGFAQNVESGSPLDVTAHFAGTSAYLADDSNTEEYDVIPNTAGTQGEGADPASSVLGGSTTTATCVTDADNDGICKVWEETGLISGVPGIAGSYAIPITSDSKKDIYVEVDCMLQSTSGNYCPSGTDLTAVTTAFARENIDLHVTLTGADTNLPFKNPFHIWTDADGDSRNDFANIKLDFFGTPTERSQGTAGTLRSGKDLLELKAQIYHYVVFVNNINTGITTTCGPSGQAELYGNDFLVSLGCGFTGAKGSPQEIQGTFLHELGHNLGLRHGGLDDDNCKPSHISVMNYARQVPWAQLAATNSGTTVNWALTYSREDLDNLNGPLDERAVIESDGLRVTGGQWTGTLPAGYQFKLIWGKPPAILTGVTGASVNWNNDANAAQGAAFSQDLNKIAGIVGCNPGATNLTPFQSYDEFANLDLNFRDGASMDGLFYPDPDMVAELTQEVLAGATSSLLTLEPIADVSAGGQITATGVLTNISGTPLANELITFSGSGAENLPSVTTNSTGGYTSSGNAPATVGTEWEVEAHFAGTEFNGPSNSNVETYDTLDDTSPPTVINTEPADTDTGVAINVIVNVTFSELMNDATITDSTFTLEATSGPVTGTVTYNSGTNTASFAPSSDLAYATEYTATVSGTVQDAAGNSMGADYTWTFTTELVPLNITGFYHPVDMEDANGDPIVNAIKSGRSVALKFEVFDNSNVEQTDTSIVQSFKQQKINCGTLQGDEVDPVEVTNTGGTSLRYDAASGTFVQNWKTPSGQAGSCYAVTLTTIDGSSVTAYFKLTK